MKQSSLFVYIRQISCLIPLLLQLGMLLSFHDDHQHQHEKTARFLDLRDHHYVQYVRLPILFR